MRVFGLLLITGALLLPLWLLSTLVMPQLNELEYTYSQLDEIASNTVNQ